MANFQFRWSEATCRTGNCFMNYGADADNLGDACYMVITTHLDPTCLLVWDFNGGGASSSLGTLKHVPETMNVVDTFPLTSQMPAQMAEALPDVVVSVEDTAKIHWPSEEEIASQSKPKAQKPKKS
jgi:hypothetical protein